MTYESERAQLEADYREAKQAAQDALTAVVNEFDRRKVALMKKHGVKNIAVEFIEQGREVKHISYPDGSSWYEVDDEHYDFDDDESAVVASAITEAIDLGLIVKRRTGSDVYCSVYELELAPSAPATGRGDTEG